jgi:hypothetical protein
MAASIQNISLSITSETGLQDALQGVITQSFTLTDYEDGSDTPELSDGRTGEIGSALYRVEGGDFTIDVTGLAGDGTYYIYVEDEGTSVAAYADATVPTWSEAKGGFYNGNAKAFFRFVLSGSDYDDRADIIQSKGYLPEDITVTNITASGTITGDVTGDLTGNVTGNVTGDLTGNVMTGYKKLLLDYSAVNPTIGTIYTAVNAVLSGMSNGEYVLCYCVLWISEAGGLLRQEFLSFGKIKKHDANNYIFYGVGISISDAVVSTVVEAMTITKDVGADINGCSIIIYI